MKRRELIDDPAVVLALAEKVCPSLNGAASFHLATALETIDARLDVETLSGFETFTQALNTLDDSRVELWRGRLSEHDAHVVTVVDDEYPANLRMVPDHPPFLFVRGPLRGL